MAELGETKTTSWREPEHRSLFDRLPGLLYIAWGPLAILVALAGCCYATVHNADTMLTFLPFLLLSFPAFGVRSSVRLTPRLMERWEHQHGGSATFPVCMTPRQGDLMLGRDQGLLSFVDGYLEYEGERSTFRIAPQDVSSVQNGPVLPEHALWVGRGYAYDLEIRLSGTEQRSVLLRQHRVHNSWDPPSVERLQNAVAAWAKTEHIEQAATELPPLEPTHLARQDCRYPLWCSAVYVATLAWMGLVA